MSVLLQQLRKAYDLLLCFFYNEPLSRQQPHVIAAMWKSSVHDRPIGDRLPCAMKPAGQNSLTVDREAVVAEIVRLCGDIIERVTCKN